MIFLVLKKLKINLDHVCDFHLDLTLKLEKDI